MAAVEQPIRPMDPPEVIDVDLLEDDGMRASQRPSQRRRISPPDSILVIDSEDEGAAERSSNTRIHEHMRLRRLARSRRIFSPPPPPRDNTIPPVPPLPHPLPMRRRAPPFPTGAVRPNSQPFSFETGVVARPPQPELTAAPRSQHRPVMGFGGALLSDHRRNGGGLLPVLQQSINYVSNVIQRITGLPASNPPPAPNPPPLVHPHGQDEILAFLAQAGAYNFGGGRVWRDRRREEVEYKPSYTHPGSGKPAAGYTFDFAPDEDPSADFGGPSIPSTNKNAVETTLVCAECRDPLVLGGLGAGAGVKGRIWGLRCGHVLDGKCVAVLMKPQPSPAVEDEIDSKKSKGKGKARATEQEDDVPDGSIRSRLRPRPSLSTLSQSASQPFLRSALKRKRPTMPKLKDRYEWTCPVFGCGKVHASLLYDGEEWVMDDATGPIGIYV
jgi:hypothetical protein